MRGRWAVRLALLALVLLGCKKAAPCPSWADIPTPTECCESCTPVDAGCGLMVCAPDSGVRCGKCPVFQ